MTASDIPGIYAIYLPDFPLAYVRPDNEIQNLYLARNNNASTTSTRGVRSWGM